MRDGRPFKGLSLLCLLLFYNPFDAPAQKNGKLLHSFSSPQITNAFCHRLSTKERWQIPRGALYASSTFLADATLKLKARAKRKTACVVLENNHRVRLPLLIEDALYAFQYATT